MDDLYQDIILDHFKHPLHVGTITQVAPDEQLVICHAHNASCGDSFTLYIRVKNHTVVDAQWQGEGCAISTASLSITSDWMIGKTLTQVLSLSREQILSSFGIDTITQGREKCIFMPLALFRQLPPLS